MWNVSERNAVDFFKGGFSRNVKLNIPVWVLGATLLLMGVCMGLWRASVQRQNDEREQAARGVWLDRATGLTWARKASNVNVTWRGAIHYCAALNLDGHTGWRLPYIPELVALWHVEKPWEMSRRDWAWFNDAWALVGLPDAVGILRNRHEGYFKGGVLGDSLGGQAPSYLWTATIDGADYRQGNDSALVFRPQYDGEMFDIGLSWRYVEGQALCVSGAAGWEKPLKGAELELLAARR